MSKFLTPSSQPPPATLPKPKQPSSLLNWAVYPPTAWILLTLTLPPPLSSAMPAWKQIACQWQKEQLLQARKKWEAQWKSWCLSTSEERREAALSAARIHAEVSVPFQAPTPKHARLTETTISNVESCSITASVPPPLSSPPHPTFSTTYLPSWGELVRQVKSPAHTMLLHRPQKR